MKTKQAALAAARRNCDARVIPAVCLYQTVSGRWGWATPESPIGLSLTACGIYDTARMESAREWEVVSL